MADLALVMPMAGRGTRFANGGMTLPKPLIELEGRPFFWWAAESVRRHVPLREMVCVVLDEHIADFAIDDRIREFYPDARIVGIPDVTSGAAETAKIGLEALATAGPVAINDSDHGFDASDLDATIEALRRGVDAALLCFPSDSPAYSYVQIDEDGAVLGTVEKHVVSPWAIAGCYFFSDPATFLAEYDGYRRDCPYDELFVSGIFNRIIARGGAVKKLVTSQHFSFGTPDEFARVDRYALRAMAGLVA